MSATLSFAALRSANLARCARWHPRGLSEWSLSDWGVATAGEMGEALNVIKKLNRERDGIAGNSATVDELRQQLADEIADVAIYLDIMAASEGIDLAGAIVDKFNRTSEKVGFPERLAVHPAASSFLNVDWEKLPERFTIDEFRQLFPFATLLKSNDFIARVLADKGYCRSKRRRLYSRSVETVWSLRQ